jgi:hypothetical protein
MNAIPLTPLTRELARRIIWFESPKQALSDPIRFMAYAMAYARHEDMRVLRRYVSDDEMREVLDGAPPGIIDPRSWAYWNSKMGRYPPPPLPVRRIPGTAKQAWQNRCQQLPKSHDLEEVRRQARKDWRDKYGGGT